ncbi:MAG: MBL fold metallo-hydrolase [Firmicutes bacterium]|nr:MBL fold metallo-hydrolase [Bacillota bacterium]
MKATVLIDNNTKKNLIPEWGLSILIEYNGHKILLDAGASDSFADNAETLGIDLADVEFAVLSHAHYDHANGMAKFFEKNQTAPFYIGSGSAENCYHSFGPEAKYIGMPQGILKDYHERIIFAEEVHEVIPGVRLIGHRKEFLAEQGVNLSEIGKKADMYVCEDNAGAGCCCESCGCGEAEAVWRPDSFDHEQSLVFETEKGLVIFNSCCHGGADNVVMEVADLYPDQKIYAIIGGFHLYETPDDEVEAFGKRLAETGVEKVVTGHCTGDRGCEILAEVLGDRLELLYTGKVMEF